MKTVWAEIRARIAEYSQFVMCFAGITSHAPVQSADPGALIAHQPQQQPGVTATTTLQPPRQRSQMLRRQKSSQPLQPAHTPQQQSHNAAAGNASIAHAMQPALDQTAAGTAGRLTDEQQSSQQQQQHRGRSLGRKGGNAGVSTAGHNPGQQPPARPRLPSGILGSGLFPSATPSPGKPPGSKGGDGGVHPLYSSPKSIVTAGGPQGVFGSPVAERSSGGTSANSGNLPAGAKPGDHSLAPSKQLSPGRLRLLSGLSRGINSMLGGSRGSGVMPSNQQQLQRGHGGQGAFLSRRPAMQQQKHATPDREWHLRPAEGSFTGMPGLTIPLYSSC